MILTSVSIEIKDDEQHLQHRHYGPDTDRKDWYPLGRDLNKFQHRLRRATQLLMFKASDEKDLKYHKNADKVVKVVKEVTKEIKDLNRNTKVYKQPGIKQKSNYCTKVVCVTFEIASISFVLTFGLPKLLCSYF